ncbi:MAG: thioredoxin domain-containing protein [Myxococcota bacterium]
MLFVSLGVALASTPSAEIGWRGDQARFTITAPAGFEISPDAPADLALRWSGRELTLTGSGGELTGGLDIGPVRGVEVEGEVAIQLCDKASGICAPAEFTVSGAVPTAKKGRVQLAVSDPPDAAEHTPRFNTDANAAADTAFAAAREGGGLVVLDFSAVWCPPCNLLAAEVLHAPDAEELLEGFEVAVLDVDHPSSWALKDRYAVGGYPTIVVVDAEGKELDRTVGYDGKQAFLDFLAGATAEKPDWAGTDPATLSADDAGRGLFAQVRGGAHEGLEAWVQASAASELPEAHLARFRLDPGADEARWLSTHVPSRALEWVPYAGDWSDTAEARAPLEEAIRRALPLVGGHEAADLLYFAAQLADEADRPTLYGAAFATLHASLSGDPVLDRAHWTFLASLQAKSGDLDGAIAFLDGLTRAHPDDPTFLLEAASLLNEHERYEEALTHSKLALGRAWGDNQLRVALEHCEALKALGRVDEARGTADKILHQDKAPADGLDVRTHRYRQKLQAFVD